MAKVLTGVQSTGTPHLGNLLGAILPAIEMAKADVVEQAIPNEYMAAHQSSAPSASSYYIQSVSYAE